LLLGSVLGPLLGGRLSDKAGRRFMLLVFYGSSAQTTLFFVVVASPGMPFWLAVYAESLLLQAYLADEASPAIRDTAFGLYFALAFGVGSVWTAILGLLIDHLGFGSTFRTMAVSPL
jgi:MFS family permease